MRRHQELFAAAGEPAVDEVNLVDIARVLQRRRWSILGAIVLGISAAAAYTALATPIYQSEATVQIHADRMGRTGGIAEIGPLLGISGLGQPVAGIDTDMLVMQSRRIVEHVSDSLDVHVGLRRPALPRASVLSAIRAPQGVVPGTVHLRYAGNDIYTIRAEPWSDRQLRHPESIEIGRSFHVGNVELTLSDELRGSAPEEIVIDIQPFRKAVDRVRGNLEVLRMGRSAQIVQVRYRNEDAVLAAAVPNAIMDGFIRYKRETSKAESRSRADFLRTQVESYRTQLAEADARLQSFREREQIISIQDQASEQVRRFAQLQNRRDELNEERHALERLVNRVRAEGSPDNGLESYRQLASFPVFFANPTIQNIIRSLIELENARAELIVRRTEASVDIQGIDKRIAELERQLLETAENYLESRRNQLASVDATLALYTQQVGTVPAREVEFARLSGQRQLLGGIFQQLQARLHEVEVEEAAEPLDAQLLDGALVPERPASPRPARNLILGGFLGAAAGLLIAFVRQAGDTSVRSRRDIQLATGGLPILATIPRIHDSADGRFDVSNALEWLRRRRSLSTPTQPLVARDAPHSMAAESYRSLRTRVFLRRDTTPSSLIITSAVAGEGKSTSAANLAVTLAQQGRRTLLIDADLRKGVLHQIFGVEQVPGLCEVLQGQTSIEQARHTVLVGEADLDVLTVGAYPRNPSELIGSQLMELELGRLRDSYDHIVIDTPPLSFATDAALLSALPETSTLVVARAEFSDRHAIERIADELHELGVRIDGVIVNDVAVSNAAAYGYWVASRGSS